MIIREFYRGPYDSKESSFIFISGAGETLDPMEISKGFPDHPPRLDVNFVRIIFGEFY